MRLEDFTRAVLSELAKEAKSGVDLHEAISEAPHHIHLSSYHFYEKMELLENTGLVRSEMRMMKTPDGEEYEDLFFDITERGRSHRADLVAEPADKPRGGIHIPAWIMRNKENEHTRG